MGVFLAVYRRGEISVMVFEPEAHRDPLAMQRFFAPIRRHDPFCAVDAGGLIARSSRQRRLVKLRFLKV